MQNLQRKNDVENRIVEIRRETDKKILEEE